MKTIKYINEVSFEEKDFKEFNIALSELIQATLNRINNEPYQIGLSETVPIVCDNVIPNKSGDKLIIGVMKEKGKYIITIEKIKSI